MGWGSDFSKILYFSFSGQYPPGAGKTGYGSVPWSGGGPGGPPGSGGQGDPYSMSRSGSMGPGPMGGGYPMGMSPEQQLRIRQEQLIQAQQARRMQQAGGGGMYPPPPPGAGGMMPPQGQPGMPPGYPAGPPMPPGSRSMKMH